MRSLSSLLLTATLTIFFTFALVPAAYGGIITDSAGEAENAAYGKKTTETTAVSSFVGRIINTALSLLGTIFLVLLVYAGYKWMTSGGNDEEITKAKALIWQAIIGLMIVMAALITTQYVLKALTNATGTPSS